MFSCDTFVFEIKLEMTSWNEAFSLKAEFGSLRHPVYQIFLLVCIWMCSTLSVGPVVLLLPVLGGLKKKCIIIWLKMLTVSKQTPCILLHLANKINWPFKIILFFSTWNACEKESSLQINPHNDYHRQKRGWKMTSVMYNRRSGAERKLPTWRRKLANCWLHAKETDVF